MKKCKTSLHYYEDLEDVMVAICMQTLDRKLEHIHMQ